MEQEEKSFEESLGRLDEIVTLLNNGRAPLAEALSLFEEGAGLLGRCSKQLDEAEQKVSMIMPDAQGNPTTHEMVQEDG